MCKSIVDKYMDRLNGLKDICLAEIIANYNHKKKKIKNLKQAKNYKIFITTNLKI